jgi:hypothetical protein
MSYREWLVGMALQGLLANQQIAQQREPDIDVNVLFACMSINAADAVITELERLP